MTTLDSIKKMVETGCKGFVCDECPVSEFCSVMSHTGETGSTLAKALLSSLSYDSDISKCKIGDWVWDMRFACWMQITAIDHTKTYPVIVEGGLHYTLDGKHWDDHKLPMLFVEPPLCFNPEPKPKSNSEKRFPRYKVHLHGDYVGTFTFDNKIAYEKWKDSELLELRKKYNVVVGDLEELPNIKIGDNVTVSGEDDREFKVLDILKKTETYHAITVKCLSSGFMWDEPAYKVQPIKKEN